jgi:large subunit ribosomal protein L29
MSKTTEALKKLRDLSSDELETSLTTTRDELFRLRLGVHTNQVVSTAAIGNKRREVARIITVLADLKGRA